MLRFGSNACSQCPSGKGLDSKDAQFRSKQWKSLTQAKLRVADKVLRSGYHMFFSDVDIGGVAAAPHFALPGKVIAR